MQTEWIAVDWGTSNLRAWVLGADGEEIARLSSCKGMGTLTPDGFEPALAEIIAPFLPDCRETPVIVCGMAGARQGWIEAPYAAAPCQPPGMDRAAQAPARDARLAVFILPGIMQDQPADVMRGEETQIGGFLAAAPDFDGVICLPGTHTKWARVSAGEIVNFQTFMTGELFALLCGKSVLRHTLTADGWSDEGFDAAIADAMRAPQSIGASLFGLRARALLGKTTPDEARARLSGLLIGMELAGARLLWEGRDVAIIGAGGPAALYARALSSQGLRAHHADGEQMALAGLKQARCKLRERRNEP